ncbi:1,3-beta-glucan synthase regulator [Bacillus sp. FJAT-27225]|uniref:SMI1/KNR4 family protein n=1 Tax=Bacillus sp. FJAT-27225 TaxID=1743144 RepID=UPI00080C2449|nr:SMI1/KNR4 family protein [Bacillus sp. FJAT-27225]OCA88117.1 1,3-beta-glucan synthase regulator [Bacillus sp. FJAT-27225]
MLDLSKIPNLIKNQPASDGKILEVENLLDIKLPTIYKGLLKQSDGFSIDGGLTIYGTEDFVERNETWEVADYATGYISIGDDGGGNVFLMLQDYDTTEVLVVDSGDMNPQNASFITWDFSGWIRNGCLTEEDIAGDQSDYCTILIDRTPPGGLKDLARIKRELGITISTAELLKGSKNPPFILAENFPYGKARKMVEKLGDTGTVISLRHNN